jgi:hypothetical protein
LSIGSSEFDFNYNPASFPVFNEFGAIVSWWLMIRVENRSDSPADSPYPYGGPSAFAVAQIISETQIAPVTTGSVVFGDFSHDVEDPRIVYNPAEKRYYMTYTRSDANCSSSLALACARLSIASTHDPRAADGWTDHGAVFGDVAGFQWTKSGAIMLGDPPSTPHYMIWANWCSFDPWVSPLYM